MLINSVVIEEEKEKGATDSNHCNKSHSPHSVNTPDISTRTMNEEVPISQHQPTSNTTNRRSSNRCNENHEKNEEEEEEEDKYHFLVLDSGPIIKRFYSNTTSQKYSNSNPNNNNNNMNHIKVWEKAKYIYTVPAVMNEIRDSQTRQYIQSLPFDIHLQEPSHTSVQHIRQFAKLTGDYHSLSHVDIQVLALLYDLELLGCHGNISHIRTTPKRKLGLGTIAALNNTATTTTTTSTTKSDMTNNTSNDNSHPSDSNNTSPTSSDVPTVMATTNIIDKNDYTVEVEGAPDEDNNDDNGDDENENKDNVSDGSTDHLNANNRKKDELQQQQQQQQSNQPPKSWASLLRPTMSNDPSVVTRSIPVVESNVLNSIDYDVENDDDDDDDDDSDNGSGGQFSDASEDDDDFSNDHDDDDERNNNDPGDGTGEPKQNQIHDLEKELHSDFPSLTAALHVPFEGEDPTHCTDTTNVNVDSVDDIRKLEEERKIKSLQPISKSGKLYNSFTKYKDLMQSTKPTLKQSTVPTVVAPPNTESNNIAIVRKDTETVEPQKHGTNTDNSSRIIGTSGGVGTGQIEDFDDDGEGWITTTKDITKLKAAGALEPGRSVTDVDKQSKSGTTSNNKGPMICNRAACVTTDFAMQNVILQMNLELLSLDGIRVRKLKNWVTRCGACYTVYTNTDTKNIIGPLGKRLFCEKCGSDVMQRIAASVDGKTGRLRLHLSKKYQYNLRGTKFSLPKPGTANRFQGDLLLREDQLLMGAWNQKLKMISGGKTRDAAQSIFGRDIATNVGCYAKTVSVDDIRVGFGRRNPNAVKGRERRGKKKKTVNTACGLRRY